MRQVPALGRPICWSTTPGVTRVERITESDPAGWDLMWRVNLRAPMRLSKAVLPGMLERGWGRIVFVATDSARAGAGGEGIYSATKAGLLGFAKSLARESARGGVTSNVVCPGLVDTAMLQKVAADKPNVIESLTRGIPMRRLGHRTRDRGNDRLSVHTRGLLCHGPDDQRQRRHHDDLTAGSLPVPRSEHGHRVDRAGRASVDAQWRSDEQKCWIVRPRQPRAPRARGTRSGRHRIATTSTDARRRRPFRRTRRRDPGRRPLRCRSRWRPRPGRPASGPRHIQPRLLVLISARVLGEDG